MDLDNFDHLLDRPDTPPPPVFRAREALDFLDARWYTGTNRRGRWMDLIGDYAGSELFIIDGDSLLEVILNDPLLSIAKENGQGFQILHAIYLLERMLDDFLTRSAVFEIVFWEANKHLILQTGQSDYVVSSRALARVLLQKHLQKLPIPVHYFEDLRDEEWIRFLTSRKPMFVMANDGGLGDTQTPLAAEISLNQRVFLLDLLSQGIAVALLEGAEFRNSKILSFVYEGRRDAGAREELPAMFWTSVAAVRQTLDLARAPHSVQLDEVPPERFPDSETCWVGVAHALLSWPQQSLFSAELMFLFITHCFLLQAIQVEERARPVEELHPDLDSMLLSDFIPKVLSVLRWGLTHSAPSVTIDLDGRVFTSLVRFVLDSRAPLRDVIGVDISSRAESLWNSVGGPPLDFVKMAVRFPCPRAPLPSRQEAAPLQLLPFDNPVFNDELEATTVDVDEMGELTATTDHLHFGQGTMFSDTNHWHAHKKTILPKYLGGEDPKPVDAKEKRWRLRVQQRFMRNLQWHAATLTGASGSQLQQISIIPGGSTSAAAKKARRDDAETSVAVKQKAAQSKAKQAAPKKKSKKDQLLDDIAQSKQKKENDGATVWWQSQLDAMSKMPTSEKITSLTALSRNKRSQEGWVGTQVKLLRLHLELTLWTEESSPEDVRDRFTISIMRMVKDLYEQTGQTTKSLAILDSVLLAMGFGDYCESLRQTAQRLDDSHALAFSFIKLFKSKGSVPRYEFMHITESPVVWQLRCFGEYMDRSMDSQPDPRVSFAPDAWQREVLDCIDNNHSLLVVAPTSAGKTFISYYAMETVLRESDEAILVYVAPTKALVTQIAAEVYARFSKNLNGRSFWAIHTRDYRIHDPQKCQILVTVPEVLATLLLSPALARVWTPRIKRIILDEIHTIGQQEGGAVWEQIILLAPCPIIGLSATIGHPEVFNSWLGSVQEAHGFKHRFIQHPHRYSHLRKYNYALQIPLLTTEFKGLELHRRTGRMRFLHPINMLSFGARVLPPDLSLESADTLSLFDALTAHRETISLMANIDDLDPSKFLPKGRLLRQKDILEYEGALKDVLSHLLISENAQDSTSTLHQVIHRLNDPIQSTVPEASLNTLPSTTEFRSNLIHLLSDLHISGDLPALLFSFDRSYCEVMARDVLKSLERAEESWRETSPEWKRKIQAWETWRLRSKERERLAERVKKQKKDADDPTVPDTDSSWESSFDPDDPSPQFSFASTSSTYTKKELDDDIYDLTRRGSVPDWVVRCLRRGIGIHHSGMNKHYRSTVESLFRLGFLRVVIATGTLALGINAPTKTSVFCGDSPFLTALMYRQCAGRAGRRGYDLLGKVVFYGIPMDRVQRLILSKLPSLGGNFPLTSTLCLRLFNFLEGSDHSPVAVSAIHSLLKLPQISFVSQSGHHQLLHHLRFSIDYLRRARLLDVNGKPMNLYGIAAHLYYTEPSNLALVALLRAGVLHKICNQSSTITAKKDFILLMSHLFGRRYLPRTYATEANITFLTHRLPSKIILPPLPKAARRVLLDHDQETLRVFNSYAVTFASQYASQFGPDQKLPLSGELVGQPTSTPSPFQEYLRNTGIRVVARSAFIANSGHTDTFSTVEELTRTVRKGLHLNEHAIPSMGKITSSAGEESQAFALNAYLLDFYTHGQVKTLEAANGIRKGDVWYLLQDFDLCLTTVRGVLEQLLTNASKEAASSAASVDESSERGDVDSGYGTFDPAEADDEGDGIAGEFKRPAGVTDQDWRVFEVVDGALREFNEKFKKMWA
ncbi:hypothetical protein JAAARDRAFT_73245 [Jaapia argillacea MUCL 33604]|uniref:P-loop containing nucleoside triphosphate hydrolase protein n=1 Tax=Jaapia argillacea MUCL 33604 TaxID=933084 RepID=A0A067PM35_9AGAM|nr:hypothetical protein JAAARDRAFT_73245 [Jaapia argillacea MUCL 33604]